MNFKAEKEHDYLLKDIVIELSNIQRLDIFQKHFKTLQLGKLIRAKTKKNFDLEITFDNLSVVIETKVDSDEGGRWSNQWQTYRIYNISQTMPLNNNKQFYLITYGTSEFYSKPYNSGAGCPHFSHITLSNMIDFINDCLKLPLSNKKNSMSGYLF